MAAVFPTLPTDNLYKFIALFGLVLVIFAFYFPQEKFSRAIIQASDADKARKLALIRIERKKSENQKAIDLVNATMEKINKSEKVLRDGDAALKAKREKALEAERRGSVEAERESKAMESDIQALHEQVQQHNEKLKKFWDEIEKGQGLIAELADEISTAKVNADADASAVKDADWQADLWSNVSIACEVIGFIMIIGGFYGWYYKVQVHQDTILRKQAGEIEKQARERGSGERA
jgi:hypothetical protein